MENHWFDGVEEGPFREGCTPLNADMFVVASEPELVRKDADESAERIHVRATKLVGRAHELNGG